MKTINPRQKTRSILGLSQGEMAELLEITRSQLSLYELGNRKLPTNALIKLGEIEKLLDNEQEIDLGLKYYETAKSTAEAECLSVLQKIADDAEYEVTLAEKKLEQMQADHENNLRMLYVLNRRKQNTQITKREKLWLPVMENELNNKLELTNTTRQILLQYKIAIAKAKADYINKLRSSDKK